MDPLQEQHERWVGDQVIDWYNSRHGTNFRFHGRCGDAPDLEYRDDGRFLRIEVVTSYYDKDDAKFIWLNARKRPHWRDAIGFEYFPTALFGPTRIS